MGNEYNITRLLNNIEVLPTLPPDVSKLPNATELTSIVLPPLPPWPTTKEPAIHTAGAYTNTNNGIDVIKTADDFVAGNTKNYAAEGNTQYYTQFATRQVVPLRLKLSNEATFWLLPIEPMLSVESKNIIAKRNVAKKRDGGGTVKEYWTQDDWQININGLFSNANGLNWPLADIQKLLAYCTAKEPIAIACQPLLDLGITHIVIEDYALPFTKGSENQSYTIKAVSDKSWNLFIENT